MMPVLPGLEMVAPMLAAAGAVPAGEGWAYEFKYDGVRAVTYIADGQVRALSRTGSDFSGSYPELRELGDLLDGRRAVLDGEVVALRAGDRPDFALLQQRMHVARPSPQLVGTVPVRYFVFDVLHLGGEDVTPLPYATRRDVLTGLDLAGEDVTVPANFLNVEGRTMLQAAELGGLEGVVAKKLTSPYRPGKRSADWTKIPIVRTQEVLVIGWKAGEGRRLGLPGSLLLAIYDERDQLVFAGHVGTGFTDKMLRNLQHDLALLSRSSAPVPDVPREYARSAHWVEPVLVGEVAYRNWTPDNRLRHPSWRGLRNDRPPRSVRRSPEPVAHPPPGEVVGALETPDHRWQVQVVQRDGRQSFRVVHGDSEIDWLDIDGVQRLLAEAGISMAELVDVTDQLPTRPRAGVA